MIAAKAAALLICTLLGLPQTSSALAEVPVRPGIPPTLESKAFEQFMLRPTTELSKIIYLIDRFSDSKIEILYEDHYYSALFASRVARFFLPRHYRQEAAEHWVLTWCSTSIPSGSPIWVKFEDGSFKLAREVLLEELKSIEEILLEKRSKK